jgi:parvulin-like peptidyl-prolyl isomerase
MTEGLAYSEQEIVEYLKLSGQMSAVLDGINSFRAVINAIESAGLEASEEELQQSADQIRISNQLMQASDTINWLQKQGMTVDDFEEMVHYSVLSSKLIEHLFSSQVESIFAERHLEYTQVALYEVVLDDEDLAFELYYSLKEGEASFHKVAKQYCIDKELGRKGGYRGLVSRIELPAEVRAAVFSANSPQLLKPILSKQGWHLIQVEEIIQAQLTPALHQKILSELFLEWIKQQI